MNRTCDTSPDRAGEIRSYNSDVIVGRERIPLGNLLLPLLAGVVLGMFMCDNLAMNNAESTAQNYPAQSTTR